MMTTHKKICSFVSNLSLYILKLILTSLSILRQSQSNFSRRDNKSSLSGTAVETTCSSALDTLVCNQCWASELIGNYKKLWSFVFPSSCSPLCVGPLAKSKGADYTSVTLGCYTDETEGIKSTHRCSLDFMIRTSVMDLALKKSFSDVFCHGSWIKSLTPSFRDKA